MTERDDALPIPAMSDDLTDRIAKEVAALVSDHIETMYPEAAEAVAWNSAKRSIQGVVRNAVKGAGDAAERGQAEQWIKRSRMNRRRFKKMWREGKAEGRVLIAQGREDGGGK